MFASIAKVRSKRRRRRIKQLHKFDFSRRRITIPEKRKPNYIRIAPVEIFTVEFEKASFVLPYVEHIHRLSFKTKLIRKIPQICLIRKGKKVETRVVKHLIIDRLMRLNFTSKLLNFFCIKCKRFFGVGSWI